MVEALPWTTNERYVVRDRDGIYGHIFRNRVDSLGLEEVVIAARSPWQNGYAERFIGSLRRECLAHVIAHDERQLLRIVRSYVTYYNKSRTHLSLGKDAPERRAVQAADGGEIVAIPEVGGLHGTSAAWLRKAKPMELSGGTGDQSASWGCEMQPSY